MFALFIWHGGLYASPSGLRGLAVRPVGGVLDHGMLQQCKLESLTAVEVGSKAASY